MSQRTEPPSLDAPRGAVSTDALRLSRPVLDMIRDEYEEMPDMRLTRLQFRRLWRLQDDVSAAAIAELVANGFLSLDSQGRIQRAGALALRIPARPSCYRVA
jgi:hypothetical protein